MLLLWRSPWKHSHRRQTACCEASQTLNGWGLVTAAVTVTPAVGSSCRQGFHANSLDQSGSADGRVTASCCLPATVTAAAAPAAPSAAAAAAAGTPVLLLLALTRVIRLDATVRCGKCEVTATAAEGAQQPVQGATRQRHAAAGAQNVSGTCSVLEGTTALPCVVLTSRYKTPQHKTRV